MEIDVEKYLVQLGKRIAHVRDTKKVSQYKLAKEIETDQSNLARIESGQVNPTIKTLLKISKALNCKVKDLIDF